jgi:hypothetical protein
LLPKYLFETDFAQIWKNRICKSVAKVRVFWSNKTFQRKVKN